MHMKKKRNEHTRKAATISNKRMHWTPHDLGGSKGSGREKGTSWGWVAWSMGRNSDRRHKG